MSDLFLNEDVRRVLRGKHVVLLGDSNVRGIYKDIVWLLNDNSFIPYECLGAKGEARQLKTIYQDYWALLTYSGPVIFGDFENSRILS